VCGSIRAHERIADARGKQDAVGVGAVIAVIAMMRSKDEVIECGCAWRSAAAGGLRRNAVIP